MQVVKRDLTQPTPMFGGLNIGAFRAVKTETFAATAAKPIRKRPCCKTCDGRACVGRCKF